MQLISFAEANNNLKSVLDQAINDADCIVITRSDAKDAVVMSLDYYNSLIETVYLLNTPANATHLAKSIEQYRNNQVQTRDLINE